MVIQSDGEKPERSALKMEIVEQLSRKELVKIAIGQQKLIEKLEQELLRELRELGGIEIGIGTLKATNVRGANAVKPAVGALWK